MKGILTFLYDIVLPDSKKKNALFPKSLRKNHSMFFPVEFAFFWRLRKKLNGVDTRSSEKSWSGFRTGWQ